MEKRMIKVICPKKIQHKMVSELKKAGSREIGGVLMGEHITENTFRIYDITVQSYGGSWLNFVRQLPRSVKNAFNQFFHKTNYQYSKYNYLGEWHSHPSFQLSPSSRDIQTMLEIMDDKSVGANFAILLIVKFELELKGDVTLFVPDYPILKGELLMEEVDTHE
jgi:proteasome lid subunit RPN8/RPN11